MMKRIGGYYKDQNNDVVQMFGFKLFYEKLRSKLDNGQKYKDYCNDIFKSCGFFL